MTEDANAELLGWAVVANVAGVTRLGPGGAQTRSGLRHFSPGTKLWVLPAQWGDGWDSAFVVGRHRGSGGYDRMVVPLRHLTDFRVAAVYSPAVIRELTRPWDSQRNGTRQWGSREEALTAISTHPLTRDRLRKTSD